MKKGRHRQRRKKALGSEQRTDHSLQERIRAVGPEHFGLLLVDSGKRHFAVRMSNFYGDDLWTPEPVPNQRHALEGMVAEVERRMQVSGLTELVVGIERTGRWHNPIKQVLEKKWPTKMIHPFTTKQLRQPDSPGKKTDGSDLVAMQRGMICGYGTGELQLPEHWGEFRLLSRTRTDLVSKRSCLRTQCSGQMEALLPGYTDLFENTWRNAAPAALIEAYPSAEQLVQAGTDGVIEELSLKGIRVQRSTVERVRNWAAQAAPADPHATLNHRILCDHLGLTRVLDELIDRYEVDLADYLVQTPAVLLLSITGINVVSACDYGSEMGPHEHYIGAKKITGRAGLFPSRFQSDQTDRPDGPVAAGRNRNLREALLGVARNLLHRNPYFRAWKSLPAHKHMSEKQAKIAVASRFARISFNMLRTGSVFNHPIAGRQDSVLCKLVAFARTKHVVSDRILELAQMALQQLPGDCLAYERQALLCDGWKGDRHSPRPTSRAPSTTTRKPEYVSKLIEAVDRRMLAEEGEPAAVVIQ